VSDDQILIGVLDVGGTHVTSAVVDTATWRLVGSPTRLPVESAGSAAAIVATFVAAAAAQASRGLGAWGVAMPDPFDYVNGIGLFHGVGKFESLFGVDIRAGLSDGIDPRPDQIAFVNDADAFVLGEWVNGAASGSARCAGMTLGTGVGSGFVADGQIVDSGPDVPPGGRAHRLSVDGVPLEELMSRRAIRRAYAAATGDAAADVRDICDRARDGEKAARRTLDAALGALGGALGPWISRFGAEVLVVGGSMANSWDVLEAPFIAGFVTAAEPPRVAVAVDADRAPLLGAARQTLAVSSRR
jgi:glucokinase